MEEETKETPASWDESHPWLSRMTAAGEDEDSVDEIIRYTLDELRLA